MNVEKNTAKKYVLCAYLINSGDSVELMDWLNNTLYGNGIIIRKLLIKT